MASLNLKGKGLTLVVMDTVKTTEEVFISLMKEVFKNNRNDKICYIGITKTQDYARDIFKKNGIDTKGSAYIDCISRRFLPTELMEDVIFVSAPSELDELADAINVMIRRGYTCFVFDSICALTAIIPGGKNRLISFYNTFSENLNRHGGSMISLCASHCVHMPLVQEASPIFDKKIEFKNEK